MIKAVKNCANIATVLTALSAGTAAQAQEPADMIALELLTGWRTDSGSHMAGLRMTLAPGWKTYWRTPGDAGIPPQFRWDKDADVQSLQVHWPVPTVFSQNGYRSVGYENEVLVPIEVFSEASGGDIVLSGEVTIGICADVCVPIFLPIDATLSADVTKPNASIVAALRDRPLSGAEAGAGEVACQFEQISDGLRLTAQLDIASFSQDEHAVIEFKDKTVWVSEASVRRENGMLVASVDMVPPEAKPFAVSRQDLTFVVIGGGQAVEMYGCVAG